MTDKKRVVSALMLPMVLALPTMPVSYASAGGQSNHLAPLVASCSSHGHNLNAAAYFYSAGPYHRWSKATWNINGKGTGNKNNVNIKLTSNDAQKWAWNSPDSLSAGQGHVGMDGTLTLAKEKEQVSFTGIFDTKGPDFRCTAATKNI